MHFQTGTIKIWASRVYPGILALFFRDLLTGQWVQFNNVVAVSQAAGAPSDQWGNAEINQSGIRPRLLSNGPGGMEIDLQYDPFPDGVHFKAIARLALGSVEASLRVVLNDDSAPISKFTFGEFFGRAQGCRFIEVNGRTYDSTTAFPSPLGGYFQAGTWSSLPLPSDHVVRFWGSNRLVQYQRIIGEWQPGDELDIEVRKTVWRPEQDTPRDPYRSPGFVWLETVQVLRTSDIQRTEWRMGLEPPRTGVEPGGAPGGSKTH